MMAVESETMISNIRVRQKKTVGEIVNYLANQYYVYGPIRSGFGAYAGDLRSAITDDIRLGCQYYHTERVLDSIYNICSEESAYVVSESKETICDHIKILYDRANKENFKRKLAGQKQILEW